MLSETLLMLLVLPTFYAALTRRWTSPEQEVHQ